MRGRALRPEGLAGVRPSLPEGPGVRLCRAVEAGASPETLAWGSQQAPPRLIPGQRLEPARLTRAQLCEPLIPAESAGGEGKSEPMAELTPIGRSEGGFSEGQVVQNPKTGEEFILVILTLGDGSRELHLAPIRRDPPAVRNATLCEQTGAVAMSILTAEALAELERRGESEPKVCQLCKTGQSRVLNA